MSKYTTDRISKVWDDEHGDHVYVGPDGDGLELAELRYVDSDGNINARFALPAEMMVEVARAILELYDTKE